MMTKEEREVIDELRRIGNTGEVEYKDCGICFNINLTEGKSGGRIRQLFKDSLIHWCENTAKCSRFPVENGNSLIYRKNSREMSLWKGENRKKRMRLALWIADYLEERL